MSTFEKHRHALEIHETMMGEARGRLAVALDLLTDALAMVGQHGVYCQSTRTPGRPTLDIALVVEQIGDAKELLQSVIELPEGASHGDDGRAGLAPRPDSGEASQSAEGAEAAPLDEARSALSDGRRAGPPMPPPVSR